MKNFKFVLLILISIFQLRNFAYAITNGENLDELNSPKIVKLSLPQDSICTGVLIGESTVLSAEHCLGDGNVNNIKIDGLAVKEILRPDNSNGLLLDLLLLRTDKKYNNYYTLSKKELPNYPIKVTIVGYGGSYRTSEDDIDWSDTKRIGLNILQIGSQFRNNSFLNIFFEIGSYNKNNYSGALPGDSGGPMIYNDDIIGIASASMFGTSNYTNLKSERAVQFLELAIKKGWDFKVSN